MKVFKFLLIIFSVSILGYGIYHSLFQTELTIVKNVQITGAQPENEKRLHTEIKIPENTSFWKIDVNQIAQTLKKDPWVDDVEVTKIFPDKIQIKVTERQPQAIVNRGANRFEFVDQENHLFGPADTKHLSEQVILSGKTLNSDEKTRKLALSYLKYFPQEGPLSKNEISEMQFAPEKGFQLILAKTGMVVDLGKDNIPLHIDRARRVVQYLDQHQINATHVDADYAKKVLVKVRKDR